MNVAGTSQGRIPFGWWVVAAAFLIMAVTVGAFYSYGVFFLPVLTELGWSRGLGSGVVLLSALVYAAAVPLAGWTADRFGFRLLCSLTAGILGLSFVLCSQIRTVWQLYLFGGVLTGLGAPVSVALPLTVVARWFSRNQGLALAVASTGIGVGTALVPLFSAHLIEGLGWRKAYAFLGWLVWTVALPASLVAMKSPNPAPVAFPETSASRGRPGPVDAPTPGLTLSGALRTGVFWSLFLIYGLCIFALGMTMTHLVAHARDSGLASVQAASLLSLIGVHSILGRLGAGALSDRIGARPVLTAGILLQAVFMVWLVRAGSPWMFYLFAALFGVTYGGNFVLMPRLTSQIFGSTSMGAIFGALSVADGIGYGTGPWLAGRLYDATGSYDISFLVVAGGLLAAALLSFGLRKKPL